MSDEAKQEQKPRQMTPEEQQAYMVYCARIVEMLKLMGSRDLGTADAILRVTDQTLQQTSARIQELEQQVALLKAGPAANQPTNVAPIAEALGALDADGNVKTQA